MPQNPETKNAYEALYWKELQENIKLNEEIQALKWKIHLLEKKLENKNK